MLGYHLSSAIAIFGFLNGILCKSLADIICVPCEFSSAIIIEKKKKNPPTLEAGREFVDVTSSSCIVVMVVVGGSTRGLKTTVNHLVSRKNKERFS